MSRSARATYGVRLGKNRLEAFSDGVTGAAIWLVPDRRIEHALADSHVAGG